MTLSMPQVSDSPKAMTANRPPTRIPEMAAWTKIIGSSRPPFRVRRRPTRDDAGPRGSAGSAAWAEQRCGRPILRPDDDPVAVLDLPEGLRGRPEVVALRIERELPMERGVHAALVQRVADGLLVVDGPGCLNALRDDLPRGPRAGGLRLEHGVRERGRLGAGLEVRDEVADLIAHVGEDRLVRLEGRHGQVTLGEGPGAEQRPGSREQAEHHRRLVVELLHGLQE